MQDSNLRPSAPKADALPNCANPRIDGSGVMRLIGRNRDLTSILALLLGYLPSESPQLPDQKRAGTHLLYRFIWCFPKIIIAFT